MPTLWTVWKNSVSPRCARRFGCITSNTRGRSAWRSACCPTSRTSRSTSPTAASTTACNATRTNRVPISSTSPGGPGGIRVSPVRFTDHLKRYTTWPIAIGTATSAINQIWNIDLLSTFKKLTWKCQAIDNFLETSLIFQYSCASRHQGSSNKLFSSNSWEKCDEVAFL